MERGIDMPYERVNIIVKVRIDKVFYAISKKTIEVEVEEGKYIQDLTDEVLKTITIPNKVWKRTKQDLI